MGRRRPWGSVARSQVFDFLLTLIFENESWGRFEGSPLSDALAILKQILGSIPDMLRDSGVGGKYARHLEKATLRV